MAIYPDKKDGKLTGRWRVEVQLGSLRKRGRFNTHPEALAAELKYRAELACGVAEGATVREDSRGAPKTLLHLFRKAAPMLWHDDATNGLTEHGQLSEAKVLLIAEQCGDVPVSSLDTAYVDEAILQLRALNKSPGTINRYLSALHAVIGWGHKRDYISKMPEFGWQDEDEGRIRYLSELEEDKLIRTLRALGFEEVADFVACAIDTGCRRSELLHAKPDQLETNSTTGVSWLRLWETKNGHARSVPLTARSLSLLQARLPWNLTISQLRYAWGKAKIAIGLSQDDDFVLHACRHTCATRLVERGVNLRVIQQFMGHRAITTTLRYAHVSDDALAAAAAGLNPRATAGAGPREGQVGDQNPSLDRHPQKSLVEARE